MKKIHDKVKIPYLPHRQSGQEIHYRRYEGEKDHAIIAEISQRYWDSLGLENVIGADDIARSVKYLDHFNPHLNLVIASIGSEPVGMAQVNWVDESGGTRLYRHLTRVTPQGLAPKIEQDLLRFSEGRLRQLAQQHRSTNDKVYSTGVAASNKTYIALLERTGYHPARYSFDMVRPLTRPIAPAKLPNGIEIRQVEPGEYRQVIAAMDEAFEDHWGHRPVSESEIQWYFNSPQFQPDLWKVAWEGDEVVGTVLNYIDHDENARFKRARGYTEDIAVRRQWRRQGIARALITESMLAMKADGMQEVALGVDTQNLTGALRLYQSLGYEEMQKYINYRKQLILRGEKHAR